MCVSDTIQAKNKYTAKLLEIIDNLNTNGLRGNMLFCLTLSICSQIFDSIKDIQVANISLDNE